MKTLFIAAVLIATVAAFPSVHEIVPETELAETTTPAPWIKPSFMLLAHGGKGGKGGKGSGCPLKGALEGCCKTCKNDKEACEGCVIKAALGECTKKNKVCATVSKKTCEEKKAVLEHCELCKKCVMAMLPMKEREEEEHDEEEAAKKCEDHCEHMKKKSMEHAEKLEGKAKHIFMEKAKFHVTKCFKHCKHSFGGKGGKGGKGKKEEGKGEEDKECHKGCEALEKMGHAHIEKLGDTPAAKRAKHHLKHQVHSCKRHCHNHGPGGPCDHIDPKKEKCCQKSDFKEQARCLHKKHEEHKEHEGRERTRHERRQARDEKHKAHHDKKMAEHMKHMAEHKDKMDRDARKAEYEKRRMDEDKKKAEHDKSKAEESEEEAKEEEDKAKK